MCHVRTVVLCLSIAVSIRLKSVKNIEKITKSMKMVSAAKYAQAERQLRPARTFGVAAQGMVCVCVRASLVVVSVLQLYWTRQRWWRRREVATTCLS